MALHTKWTSGDLTFYDGTQDVFKIQDDTEGVEFGEDDEGIDVKFYGETTGAYMLWEATTGDTFKFVGGAGLDIDGGDIALGDEDAILFGDTGDFAMAFDGTNLDIIPSVAHIDMELGSSAYPLDVKLFGNTAAVYAKWQSSGDTLDFIGADISLNDSDHIYLGTTNDFSISFDGTNLDIAPDKKYVDMELGTAALPLDVKFFGATGSSAYMKWQSSGSALDFSGADIEIGEDDFIKFGSSGELTMRWTAGNAFEVIPDAPHANMELGSTDFTLDVRFFSSGQASYMEWLSTGPVLSFVGTDIELGDSDYVYFGTTNDFAMSFDGTDTLSIIPSIAHKDLELGNATYPLDVKFFGNTGVAYMQWQSSGDTLAFTSGAGISLGTSGYISLGDTGNFTIGFDATNLDIVPDTAHDDMELGSFTYPLDVKFFGNTGVAYMQWVSSGDTLTFTSGAGIALGTSGYIAFGDSGDVTMGWDTDSLNIAAATGHVDLELGNATYPLDVKFFGNTGVAYMQWQSSGDTLKFTSGAGIQLGTSGYITLGDTGNFTLGFDATELNIIPDVAHVDLELGSATYPLDVKFFGNTGTATMKWESSGDRLTLTSGASIKLGTSGSLTFGDTGDFAISFDATELNILPDVAHVDLELGSFTYPLDVKFFGNTGVAYMKWESSGDRLLLTSGASIKLGTSGSLTFGDTGNFAIAFDATELNILPDVAHVDMELGSFTYPLDVKLFGNTGVAYMQWQSSGDELVLFDADISLGDADYIKFGATDEATMRWTTGDSLEITATGGNLYLNAIITHQDPDTTGSTGTINLGTTSNRIQFLHSTSTGYFVTVPQSTLSAGIEFKIFNLSTVNNALKIYENTTGGTLIATVADNYAAIVVSDGTDWGSILGSTQY